MERKVEKKNTITSFITNVFVMPSLNKYSDRSVGKVLHPCRFRKLCQTDQPTDGRTQREVTLPIITSIIKERERERNREIERERDRKIDREKIDREKIDRER